MREVRARDIQTAVEKLVVKANLELTESLEKRIRRSAERETDSLPKMVMDTLVENLDVARELKIPICQDTGMAVVFADIGQEAHIIGGDFETAINEGVRRGYVSGKLRFSVVNDPIHRINTNDNTPAIIHTRIVPGDTITLHVAPKGFGSENMSQIKMMNPSATRREIMDFIVAVVKDAGSNACPPMVVGVGIGGNFETCAMLAKKALARDVASRHNEEYYKMLEEDLLHEMNELNIGPQGFGGKTSVFAINIEKAPTHIAGLPVAVNIGCHATRSASEIL